MPDTEAPPPSKPAIDGPQTPPLAESDAVRKVGAGLRERLGETIDDAGKALVAFAGVGIFFFGAGYFVEWQKFKRGGLPPDEILPLISKAQVAAAGVRELVISIFFGALVLAVLGWGGVRIARWATREPDSSSRLRRLVAKVFAQEADLYSIDDIEASNQGAPAAEPLARRSLADPGGLGRRDQRAASSSMRLTSRQREFGQGAGVTVDLHPVSSLLLGGFDTPSLQGGPDEQRCEELHLGRRAGGEAEDRASPREVRDAALHLEHLPWRTRFCDDQLQKAPGGGVLERRLAGAEELSGVVVGEHDEYVARRKRVHELVVAVAVAVAVRPQLDSHLGPRGQ